MWKFVMYRDVEAFDFSEKIAMDSTDKPLVLCFDFDKLNKISRSLYIHVYMPYHIQRIYLMCWIKLFTQQIKSNWKFEILYIINKTSHNLPRRLHALCSAIFVEKSRSLIREKARSTVKIYFVIIIIYGVFVIILQYL